MSLIGGNWRNGSREMTGFQQVVQTLEAIPTNAGKVATATVTTG